MKTGDRQRRGNIHERALRDESLVLLTPEELAKRWRRKEGEELREINRETLGRIAAHFEIPMEIRSEWIGRNVEQHYGSALRVLERLPDGGIYGVLSHPRLPTRVLFRLSDVVKSEVSLRERPELLRELHLYIPDASPRAQESDGLASAYEESRRTRKGQRDEAYPEVRKICLRQLRNDKKRGRPYMSAPDLRKRVLKYEEKGALAGLKTPSMSAFYRWRKEFITEIENGIKNVQDINTIK